MLNNAKLRNLLYLDSSCCVSITFTVIKRNFENYLSALATVTGNVRNSNKAVTTSGKTSLHIRRLANMSAAGLSTILQLQTSVTQQTSVIEWERVREWVEFNAPPDAKAFGQVTAVSFLQIFSCCSYNVFVSCYQVSRKENIEKLSMTSFMAVNRRLSCDVTVSIKR